MDVGFTGTRQGMSGEQATRFLELIEDMKPLTLHHGDCVGADAMAHEIVSVVPGVYIIIHPPTNSKARAWKVASIIKEDKPYLERNHDIVDESDVLIAIPDDYEEKQRSGTWATIRYARKKHKQIIIIYPCGNSVTNGELEVKK